MGLVPFTPQFAGQVWLDRVQNALKRTLDSITGNAALRDIAENGLPASSLWLDAVVQFGADPTGAKDSTTAIQNAINAGQATGQACNVWLRHGTYRTSKTLLVGGLAKSVAVNLIGESGSESIGTTLQWYGPTLQPMLQKINVLACLDTDLLFDGRSSALACALQSPSATGLYYHRCTYTSPAQIPVWTAGLSVTVNVTYCLAPASSSSYADNGHLYLCTNAGSGTTAGSSTTFPTTTGASSTADANGVVWTEVGPSPAAFLVGGFNPFPGGISQDDTTRWTECGFFGLSKAAGWRPLSGGNIKNFSLTDCQFLGSAIGLDNNFGSGFCKVSGASFGNNGLDVRHSSSQLEMASWYSEGSAMLLYGSVGGGGTGADIREGQWLGATVGAGAPFIVFGGQLALERNYFQDSNTDVTHKFPIIQVYPNTFSLRSEGNFYVYKIGYAGPYFLPLYDNAGTAIAPGSGHVYAVGNKAYVSFGDTMQDAGGGGVTQLPSVFGQLFQSQTQWGAVSIGLGTGSVVLADGQYIYRNIVLTGALSGNVTVTFPTIPGWTWVIDATAVTLNGHTITAVANSTNWGTTIGTTNVYEVTYAGVAGQLYGSAKTP